MILGHLPKGKINKKNNLDNYRVVIATMRLAISRSVLRHVATTGQRNNTKFSDGPLCKFLAKYEVFWGLTHIAGPTDVRLSFNYFLYTALTP
jgi:hypothetical protein